MNWLEKWCERRRIEALQRRVARMREQAAKAEEEALARLMPAMETITGRIRDERLAVLEKALDKVKVADGKPQTGRS